MIITMAKKKKTSFNYYKTNNKAQSHCFKKGYVIYPDPVNPKSFKGEWRVSIELGHRKHTYPEILSLTEAYIKIWKEYEKIQNRDNNGKT